MSDYSLKTIKDGDSGVPPDAPSIDYDAQTISGDAPRPVGPKVGEAVSPRSWGVADAARPSRRQFRAR